MCILASYEQLIPGLGNSYHVLDMIVVPMVSMVPMQTQALGHEPSGFAQVAHKTALMCAPVLEWSQTQTEKD